MSRFAFRSLLHSCRSWRASVWLALGLGGGALGAWQLHVNLQEKAQHRLESSADEAVLNLQKRLQAYAAVLERLDASLDSQVDESQQLFAEQAHEALSQIPLQGLQALSLTRAVADEGQLHGDEQAYQFVTSALWPLKGNEILFGSYARQPSAAWQSLQAALRSGDLSASAPFHFYQVAENPLGVLLSRPIFARDYDAQELTAQQPSAVLLGLLNASIRLPELAAHLVPTRSFPFVAMRLMDLGPWPGSEAQAARVSAQQGSGAAALGKPRARGELSASSKVLFTGSMWAESAQQADFAAAPVTQRNVHVHGRLWQLQFKPAINNAVRLEKAAPWAVLALGGLIGLVLALTASGWWQSRFSWLQRIRSSQQMHLQSDLRFQTMCERAQLGVLEVDLDSRQIVQANAHFCRMTGYSEDELSARPVLQLLRRQDRERCKALLKRVQRPEQPHLSEEFCLHTRSGAVLWVELNAFLQGPPPSQRILVLLQDISARKQLEHRERQSYEQLRSLMQHLPVGLVMEDHEGRLIYWNEEFLRLAGQAGAPDSHSQHWWQRMYPDEAERERVLLRWRHAKARARAALYKASSTALPRALDEEGADKPAAEASADGQRMLQPSLAQIIAVEDQEVQLRGMDGLRRPVLLSGVMQQDGCLMVLQDQSLRRAAEQEARRLAFYDALTDLPNRRLMTDRLQQALEGSLRRQHYGGVVLLDIDNFKAFNEAFGLEQGDQLLVGISQRSRLLLPAGATMARQSGDEFLLLIDDLGSDPVAAAARLEQEAQRWMRGLREPMQVAGESRRITVSLGLSLFGDQPLSVEEVLRRAEMAMYQAKSQGRNTRCFFDPQLQRALQERRTLEQHMREGLESGQFELYYQPQVEKGHIFGAEALLRWEHPVRGKVAPAEFIPLAEETGFILRLGEWVLHAACEQLARWAKHPRYAQLEVSVNVSPSQFLQPGFVDQVLKALAEHGADASKLKLELTEGMLVTDVDNTIAKMVRLKSYGIGFSLDDFGTGYSSLAYLKRLPLDQLKIDRSFVRDVLTDPNDAAIARTIVALAKSLGLHVIAEGVETQAQCRFLEDVRCHAWQGYLMSPAVPAVELERLVTHAVVPGAVPPALSPVSMR